ncbi:TadE/TadG family type IV pilus assembly protein [Actinophytocola sp.]|uniref:TadE/TadG family type IV pilus assembly protein n=1 Tax=Actinophytocola sp. TaxID=1872138 RepID=UPI0025C51D11|nr:TadE/TadG family type IV pilus assembly protein [Actinophytocola sp.]
MRPPLKRAALRRPWTDERGAATTELVLAIPLLLLLLMLIAQFALWMHATHIAQAAASEALSATRVEGGTVAHGQAEADRILQQLGGGPLHSPHASVTRGPADASVHVEGTVTAVVPFLTLTAVGDAAGPVERFVPMDYGFRSGLGHEPKDR